MKTYQVTLPDETAALVDRMLEDGPWNSIDELVENGIGTLQEDVAADEFVDLDALRAKLQVGLDQYQRGEVFDGEEVFAELEADIESGRILNKAMSRYRLSPIARSDLREIAKYHAQFSKSNARRISDSIKSRCQGLAASPRIGRARLDLIAILRSSSVGDYVIYYREIKGGIYVVRIMHGARDIQHKDFS